MSDPARSGTARGGSISLRISPRQKMLIDRAAEALGQNRSEFLLESACREATAVLLDRTFFMLDEVGYERFSKALDAPPKKNAGLERLLSSRPPWER